MTSSLAVSLPQQSPRPSRDERAPYIEIAPSRSQRRARPKLAYALVVVGGLFAVLVSQLLLSIALADGAYEIAALQSQQKELTRDEQIATEKLDVLNSPQNLAVRAESLGMVSNDSAVYLSLATGAVMGQPTAASADAGSVIGSNGSLLVQNSLINDIPDMGAILAAQSASDTEKASDTTAGGMLGASDAQTEGGSVASSPDGIPAPQTR
ncbi:hypothetical protein FB562_1238 [Homoserinimonas aerilata]|uniref:Cell division protein FtsL n=1 Tax=Homoserinimonas aerilata TaxID=1162970 RepID=A0A542YJ85_9MICO|nr:hypothetical protein [Homoserinimonas aerilata]TQL48155.1 hypothetical protein FB562_1238 [Homoserinimonas aerilata]